MFLLIVASLMILSHVRCAQIPDEMKEAGNALHGICMQKSGVDLGVLNGARSGNWPAQEDEKLKCYIGCIYDEAGWMDEAGNIDVEALIQAFPERLRSVYGPPLRACGTQHGKDRCDTGYKTAYCIYEQNPEVFFII